MKSRLIPLTITIACLILILSCSSSNPTTTTTTYYPTYLSTNDSSYWAYTNSTADSNGMKNLIYLDSVYYGGTEFKLNYMSKRYIENINDTITSYHFYENNTNLWSYSDFISLMTSITDVSDSLNIASVIPEKLYLLIDKSQNSWDVADFSIDTVKYNLGKISGTIKISAEKGNTENIVINNNILNCQNYNYVVTFTGAYTGNTFTYPINYTRNISLSMADGIGLVRMFKEAKIFEISTLGKRFNILGFEKDLDKYNIVK